MISTNNWFLNEFCLQRCAENRARNRTYQGLDTTLSPNGFQDGQKRLLFWHRFWMRFSRPILAQEGPKISTHRVWDFLRLTATYSNRTPRGAVRARRGGLSSNLLSKFLQYLHSQKKIGEKFLSVVCNTLPVAAQRAGLHMCQLCCSKMSDL